ncbi:extracellular solute-binding protein [Streptomyces sp. SCUT-3]|uniref:ABC transporter substrate-binding protein n=1 Tax=Streptomyces sp. SCUT-3 TaxID=2684469 RepID=UPI000CC639DB|nr:ABC transporter substrate-binding protein [Streptomyces sp. SCUT-3]PLW69059.1 ABC transporter substrate-binding protein [Streptomyces sp. DJ]QMV24792.1 extracellular solute-binding protein [Streptomyces sp. SCUT-3]
MPLTRRHFLQATGLAAGGTALTACGGGQAEKTATPLSVYSWWTGGGEEAGLKALVEDFRKNNPDVKFVNEAVAGGAGDAARKKLASRLAAGNPPDTFQGHAGAELNGYIEAGQLEDISFLYVEEGWRQVLPVSLRSLISDGATSYSVPVNVHRANMMWHSPKVLERAGVSDVPTTFDALLEAMDRVKAAGAAPLALGEQWTVQHLLETVLLGVLGPRDYGKLWTGRLGWESGRTRDALETFDAVLDFGGTYAPGRTWQAASKQLADGRAAFQIMGDWVDAYLGRDLSLTPKKDYHWSPVPQTAGAYQFLSDSFVLPKGAAHREAALAWLRTCGSRSGQQAFNVKKGSIPARTDTDPAPYGPYLQWALSQWRTDEIVGSLTHGVVAKNEWVADIGTALGGFLKRRNVPAFQEALARAADKHI